MVPTAFHYANLIWQPRTVQRVVFKRVSFLWKIICLPTNIINGLRFWLLSLSCAIRIESHAEHGGTLNEHQLNRLVSRCLVSKIYFWIWHVSFNWSIWSWLAVKIWKLPCRWLSWLCILQGSLSDQYFWPLFICQHAILKPFMLRRVKKDVVSELTTKTEVTMHCKLSSRQQAFYQAIKNKISLAELFDSNRGHLNEIRIMNLMNIVIQLRKVLSLSFCDSFIGLVHLCLHSNTWQIGIFL